MSKLDKAKFKRFAQEAKEKGACAVVCAVTYADDKDTSLFYDGQVIDVLVAAGTVFLKIASDLHIGLDTAIRIVGKEIMTRKMEKERK